jgi:glycosyltransferase involved in cell wall biosynthesis
VRVAVDGRSLRRAATSRGITRYVRRLLVDLARGFPEDRFAVLVPGGLASGDEELRAAGVELRAPRLDSRPLFAAAALAGRPRLDRMLGGCDVVWVPAIGPLAVSSDVPLVLTVHDLSFEHRPGDFSAYERVWHRLARPRNLARRASHIVAVSEVVRREVVAEWGLPADRVVTVRSGPGREPTAPGPLPSGLPESYVLAVGALEPRKDPRLLVRAHARARASGLTAGLVFAGDGPLREELSGSGATVLGHVPDPVLEGLYRRALVVACPSREEGFSFSPIEALSRGTPAVVSDLPVFAETVMGGALRVPPGDVDALAQALLRLEREPDLRAHLVSAGQSATSELSWERAAAETREVLRRAAGG